jgi:hypothetical protein
MTEDRYVYKSNTAGEEAWATHKLQPPWTRVCKAGQDVPDEDP